MRLDRNMCELLPAWEIAAQVNEAMGSNNAVVVTAPPGAGKSTLLPLTVLQWLESDVSDSSSRGTAPSGKMTPASVCGKIIMLEPRRIAARQVAERMASMMGEKVGETVGYRVRMESKVSSATRIEVVTEGILTRMLVDDPTLESVAVVIFDEFHERNVHSDVSLAMLLEAQGVIRPDLKLLIMSATIDAGAICSFLGARHVACGGRCFPVENVYCGDPADVSGIPSAVAKYVRVALNENEGDVLAFLPGEGEIRKCRELLSGLETESLRILPLYGMLPFEAQRLAVMPSLPGKRKVVLATPVAETSLTIEGVRAVVDSGYCRKMVFDPKTGLSRMETVRVSLDMAQQRAGRAGRVSSGRCYRLWCSATEGRMAEMRVPEILECDLAPTVLDIAAWGCAELSAMRWLTPPPEFSVNMAVSLLTGLGALDGGSITQLGRELSSFPCHPRIARMLSCADTQSRKALACDIAALLEERDPLGNDPSAGVDVALRVSTLRRMRNAACRGVWGRISRVASRYCAMCGVSAENAAVDPYEVGGLLCAAYPERIACQVSGRAACYQLSTGEMVRVGMDDPVSSSQWIAVAAMNARKGAEGSVFLAGVVDESDVRKNARWRLNSGWDSRKGVIVAREELRVGVLVLATRPVADLDDTQCAQLLCRAAAREGESMFDFNDDVQNLQRRVAMASLWHPELSFPGVDTASLLGRAADWVPSFCAGARSVQALKKLDLCGAILSLLSYEQQKALDEIAPESVPSPSGRRVRLEYRPGASVPVMKIKLQDCFGMMDTPRVDYGRRPILVELLSPGYKPVQLTSDLRSFWENTYFEVRKELKRRYPKHPWPEKL